MEHQRKHSQFFRWTHAFCSMVCAAASMTPLTILASWGQMDTQRMQEMQAFLSTLAGSTRSMACTGHFSAHKPHFTQALVGLGTIPAPPLL